MYSQEIATITQQYNFFWTLATKRRDGKFSPSLTCQKVNSHVINTVIFKLH